LNGKKFYEPGKEGREGLLIKRLNEIKKRSQSS